MLEEAKISIVIVSYNSSKTIERTIQSIKKQTYKNIEIVYVDGGSSDGTREIIRKFASTSDIMVFEKDKGIYDAMNKGIQYATGEYKFILNSDDLYADSNILEEIIETFKNNSDKDIVIGEVEYFKGSPSDKTGRIWKIGKYFRGAFIHGWHPPHPAFFVKSQCYDENTKFQIDLKIAADYELMLRLMYSKKLKAAYINKTTTLMDSGGVSGKFKSKIAGLKDVVKALWRNNLRIQIPYIVIMRYASKIMQ